jgi:hypothetical protein
MSDLAEHQARLQREKQRAAEDIADIEALAKTPAFERYWVRRLNERYRTELASALHGGNAETREQARVRAVLLEQITKMPAEDRMAAQKVLERAEDPHPKPRQVT